MSNQENLKNARKAKNDEFYTRYSDIEKEISLYKKQLEGKVIYCNCDNPHKSKFVKFFLDNFKILKLKKLYATGYNVGHSLSYDGIVERESLNGNGDFRSQECLELLAESDIVITNPPFSLFRDFLKLLVDSGKKFLVLGNQNDIACKEVTQMLIDKKFWFGHKRGKMIFDTLSGPKAFGNIRWFTNLEVSGIDFLNLTCKYSQEAYKKYDNYDAINVDRVDEIPADYSGVMGVPISFLDKWNPEQFEILGVTGRDRFRTKMYPPHIQHGGSHDKELVTKLNTVGAFVIPDKLTDKVCYELDGKFYSGVYRRLLIRKVKH